MALESIPLRYSKVRTTTEGEVQEKYWNKLPASAVTVPFVNICKKRLEKVFTEIFSHLPNALTHPPPLLTCMSPINSHFSYMQPNALVCLFGSFRVVVA